MGIFLVVRRRAQRSAAGPRASLGVGPDHAVDRLDVGHRRRPMNQFLLAAALIALVLAMIVVCTLSTLYGWPAG